MKYAKPGFNVLARIEEEKKKREWTNYTLSVKSGVAESTISTWYKKHMTPTVASIEMICNGFGMTLSEFFKEPSNQSVILNQTQQEVLDLWSLLSPEQRSDLYELLNASILR